MKIIIAYLVSRIVIKIKMFRVLFSLHFFIVYYSSDNYAFIVFDEPEDAMRAIEGEGLFYSKAFFIVWIYSQA